MAVTNDAVKAASRPWRRPGLKLRMSRGSSSGWRSLLKPSRAACPLRWRHALGSSERQVAAHLERGAVHIARVVAYEEGIETGDLFRLSDAARQAVLSDAVECVGRDAFRGWACTDPGTTVLIRMPVAGSALCERRNSGAGKGGWRTARAYPPGCGNVKRCHRTGCVLDRLGSTAKPCPPVDQPRICDKLRAPTRSNRKA